MNKKVQEHSGVIWLLGRQYKYKSKSDVQTIELENTLYQVFLNDLKSRLWITYRYNFEAIKPTNYTTDCGWGCMLRSGQMLLAQALINQFLGREWRLQDSKFMYIQILYWFMDHYASDIPYSIHKIAKLGTKYNVSIGEWFGPSTTAQVLKALIMEHRPGRMACYTSNDGGIYKNEIVAICQSKIATTDLNVEVDEPWAPLLLILPLRLGIDAINPIYASSIKAWLTLPQSVGIAGGKPNSSLYFIGFEDDDLIYLDPHYARASVDVKSIEKYKKNDFASYHCDTVRKVSINLIDPSILVGFFCRNQEQFDDLCLRIERIGKMAPSVITVGNKAPIYSDMELFQVESDYEMC